MSIIVPAILELTTEKLIEQIKRVEQELPEVSYVHIDIMDGVFVPHKTDIDVTAMENLLTRLKFELHLMVHDPIPFMGRWSGTPHMYRVIAHQESSGGMNHFITTAHNLDYDFGVAVNPETDFVDTDYRTFDLEITPVEVVQFMTVHPGDQGAPFVQRVVEKIKIFQKQKPVNSVTGKSPLCSVDGHVTPETIGLLRDAGVDIFNVGSYLMHSEDMKASYNTLKSLIH